MASCNFIRPTVGLDCRSANTKEIDLPRVLKEYAVRKDEFLDAAQALFYTKGYEQTSVNAILEKVGVAKGTFYHYFKSKEALLDSLIERMTGQIIAGMKVIVENPDLDAITKLNQVFQSSGSWKAAHMAIPIPIRHTLYNPGNLIMLRRMTLSTTRIAGPLIAKIIQQGKRERVFDTEFPEELGELLYMQFANWREKLADLLLGIDKHPEYREKIIRFVDIYNDTTERFLRAPRGSIMIFDRQELENSLE